MSRFDRCFSSTPATIVAQKEKQMSKFVFADDAMSALEIGFVAGENIILHGPAGHGKSELVQEFFESKGLRYGEDVFVKSLHGDSDEASLFGGLDFQKLNDREAPDLRYHLSRSFMASQYAVFEEMFDAPASVVTALKDVLTSKRFRGGEQTFPLSTTMVVGITNKSPQEISDISPSHHALTERFPLQLEVKWPSYKRSDYLSMFQRLGVVNDNSETIAALAGESYLQGRFISPRSAVKANSLCNNGFGTKPLRFMPGFREMFGEIERLEREQLAAGLFETVRTEMRRRYKLLPEYSPVQRADKRVQSARNATAVGKVAVPSGLVGARDDEVVYYFNESARLKGLEGK